MSIKKVMLDAGHYGKVNQSPVFKSYYESVMTFKLVDLIQEYLESNYTGLSVSKTRSVQTKDLALYNRGYAAKGYDFFGSFHSNACGTESIDRVVVIHGIDASSSIKSFALDWANEIKETMGVKDASKISNRYNSAGTGEYYGVLRGAKAAGVSKRFIIEHSFHTNEKSARWLYEDSNLVKLAKTDAIAIANYLGATKKTSSSSTSSTSKTSSTGFLVKLNEEELKNDPLNVREGAGTSYDIVKVSGKNLTLSSGTYTIIETKTVSGTEWGLLKSKVGWISLNSKYVTKL